MTDTDIRPIAPVFYAGALAILAHVIAFAIALS